MSCLFQLYDIKGLWCAFEDIYEWRFIHNISEILRT